jgi:cardiolipin synthase
MQTGLLVIDLVLPLIACTTPSPVASTSALITPAVSGEQGPTDWHEARKTVSDVASQAPDPDSFDELLSTIGALAQAPLYKHSRADLLIDGPATYRAMGEAIGNAKEHIYLETYIFADDEVGQKFADLLVEKARQGVRVCIIYDSIGSLTSSDAFFDEMQQAGIKLIEYNAVNPMDGGNPLEANTRDHRKLLIVDDSVAFTGGINFSRTYSSGSSRAPARANVESGWRDTHVALYGPVVEGVHELFREQWQLQGGSAEDVPLPTTPPAQAGRDLVAMLQSKGGDGEESSIYRAYIEAIKIAADRIWITQAYFAPDKVFLTELKRAATRGVDVRILVPGISDSSLVLYASRSRYGELLGRGVAIYENTSSVLHAKAAVIDGLWSTVGSSNLDYRSFLHNDEANAMVLGTDFAEQMEKQFLQDIGHSRSVTLEQWNERPLLDRIREWFSWSVEYWL